MMCVLSVHTVCCACMVCAVFAMSAVWIDSLRQDCDPIHYPIEFVNSCTLSGIPDHELILKKGAPYIVMHNTSAALCNGTRVKYLRRVGKHCTLHTSHTSHVTLPTSQLTLHMSHFPPRTSHFTLHISHITHHTSHITLHTQARV